MRRHARGREPHGWQPTEAGERRNGEAAALTSPCPVLRRGVLKPSPYFAESTRVLAAEYDSAFRKASHGLLPP